MVERDDDYGVGIGHGGAGNADEVDIVLGEELDVLRPLVVVVDAPPLRSRRVEPKSL